MEFSRLAGMPIDWIRVRRALAAQQTQVVHGSDETAKEMPNSNGFAAPREWSKRLGEAAQSLGVPLRQIETDGPPEWSGFEGWRAAVTCVSSSPPVWAVVDATNGAPAVTWHRHAASGMDAAAPSRTSFNELTAALPGPSPMHWTVLDPLLLPPDGPLESAGVASHGGGGSGHGSGVDGGHEPHATPIQRLMNLLRLEWSDVWIVLVFSFVVGVLSLAIPVAVESLVNTVAFGQFLQPVVILSILLFVFLLFAALLRALQIYVVEIIQRRMFVRVAGVIGWRMPRVQHEACDSQSLRELSNRFFDIVTIQKSAAILLLDGISLLLAALVGMAVLAFYHPLLLAFDVVLVLLATFAILVLGRGAVQTAIDESRAKYDTASWFEQVAASEVAFKTPGAGDLALARADRLVSHYLSRRSQHFRVVLRQSLFALMLQALASTVLLGLGGWLVIQGQLTLGQLVAAELIVTVIVGSFAKFGKHMETYYDLLASLAKVGHLTDLPTEQAHGTRRLSHTDALSVRLDDVCYRFAGHAGHPVLDAVHVNATAGSIVAVVGPSGAGKSTLLELLYGLRLPQEGMISVAGADLRDIDLGSLRQTTAFVRGIEVFEGTIDENLVMGRTDRSDEEIRDALHDADLLSHIHALPAGRGTRLLEGGAPLSNGLLLRLMLARALVGRPRLMLIDGVLDALPDETAETIVNAMRGRRMTVFLVTGRKTLIDRCDQVLRLSTARSEH